MKVYRGVKYRLYPNDEQVQIIEKTFECCRQLWNKTLEHKLELYEKYKKNINGTVVTMCKVELHTYLGIHLTDEEAETLELLLNNILKSDVPEEYYLVKVNTTTRYA